MQGAFVSTVTTTGSAGSAAGTATTLALEGWIDAIKLDWSASAPATSDVTIVEVGGLGRTIYTKSNSVTDVTFYPALQKGDNTGTAISGAYGRIYLPTTALIITIAQCDALTAALVVTITMTNS